MSEKKREEWFKIIEVKKKAGVLNFSIGFSSAKVIDIYGIVYAINKAIEKIFSEFKMKSDECVVLLDGNLKAPKKFKNQKTIIKGDEKELIISLASIIAKVSRDRYIVNLSKKYPEYGFEKHKGYGTKSALRNDRKTWDLRYSQTNFSKKFSN